VLRDVCDAKTRVNLLQTLRRQGRLSQIQAVVQRASRLAEKGELAKDVLRANEVVDASVFESPSEAAMLEVLNGLTPMTEGVDRYEYLANGLAESAETLAAFFDGPDSVMVMCEDRIKRVNRLNLLAVLRNQASVLADFNPLIL